MILYFLTKIESNFRNTKQMTINIPFWSLKVCFLYLYELKSSFLDSSMTRINP